MAVPCSARLILLKMNFNESWEDMKFAFSHQSLEKRRDMILSGSIPKTLMLLSFPTLMMGLIQSLMPLSDGLFINNVAGTYVASAVTYCQPILNIAISLSLGLGAAAMAIIGQLNGRGEFQEGKHVSSQLVVFSFLLGLLIAPLMVLIAFPIANIVTPEISYNVWLYIALSAAGMPFYFMEAIYNAIKNANGKPEATFFRVLILLILKIIFNVIFIVWLRLEIVGCVLSTILANVLICIWMFHELFIKDSEEKLERPSLAFDREVISRLLRIGFPSMLANIMLNVGFYLINNEVQKYGAIVLNGQGIAGNITTVCFNVPSAFGAAVTTMVSMNVGAHQGARAKRSTLIASLFSALTAIALIAIIAPLSPYLTILFTRQTEVLDFANKALHIYIYSVVGFGVCMVQQGAFIGLGRTKVPLFIGILRVWLLRYLFILATERYLGVFAVFWGNLFSNYMAAVIITLMLLRVDWVSVIDLHTPHPEPAQAPGETDGSGADLPAAAPSAGETDGDRNSDQTGIPAPQPESPQSSGEENESGDRNI